MRATTLKDKGRIYEERKRSQKKRKIRKEGTILPEDPLESVFD